jgi:hypothetical protein
VRQREYGFCVTAPTRLSRLDSAIRTLGTSRDPEDDHETLGIVDHVDHPEIANAKAPEVRSRELQRTRRTRLDREGEDRASQSGGIAWRQASELTLGGGREIDSVLSLAHASRGP